MKEKRKSPRFEINQLIDVSMGKQEFIGATGVNISESGLLTKVDTRLENGARVYLLLTDAQGKHPIEVEGIVARTEKKGKAWHVGIQFADLTANAEAGIHNLVNLVK